MAASCRRLGSSRLHPHLRGEALRLRAEALRLLAEAPHLHLRAEALHVLAEALRLPVLAEPLRPRRDEPRGLALEQERRRVNINRCAPRTERPNH